MEGLRDYKRSAECSGSRLVRRKQDAAVPLVINGAGFLFRAHLTRELGNSEEDFPEPVERSYAHESNFQRLDRVGELAREKGMSVPQVALAWVVQQPGLDVFALVGTFTGAEFSENLKALEVKLTAAEMEWLDLRRDDR